MIFVRDKNNMYSRFYQTGLRKRINQARGMYGLRREGENTKTVETKAAVTGANIALVTGKFKLC